MTKTKLVEIHVTPWLGGLGWAIKVNGRRVSRFAGQAEAQACAIFLARLMPAATVKLHDRRGWVASERTYPRGADPKKSPG